MVDEKDEDEAAKEIVRTLKRLKRIAKKDGRNYVTLEDFESDKNNRKPKKEG